MASIDLPNFNGEFMRQYLMQSEGLSDHQKNELSRFSALNMINGFVISYRELGKSSWQKSSACYNDTEHELLMLKEYSLYTIRVFAFTCHCKIISLRE